MYNKEEVKMLKLLIKDQINKLKNNKFQFIAVSLLVIIISLTFVMVKTSTDRLEESYDSYLEEQNVEDFYFSITNIDVNYLSGTAFTELCDIMNVEVECYTAVSLDTPEEYNKLNILLNNEIKDKPHLYEQFIDSYLTYFETDYNFTIEKQYVVDVDDGDFMYKFISIHEVINLPHVVEGRLPENNNEVMIFKEFAEENDLELYDDFTVKDKTYVIVGFAYTPEFVFPILSLTSIEFDPEYQTLIFANENTLRTTGYDLFTRYTVKGDLSQIVELDSYQAIQTTDKSTLGRHMQMVSIILPRELNFRIITLDKEVTNANLFINTFLVTFVVLITILLLIFIKRYIDKYKKDINILHSLGYSKKEISLSYMVFPFFVSITSVIGYIIGFILSGSMFTLYSSRYYFPKADLQFSFETFALAVFIPILVINILSFLFIYRNINKQEKTVKRIKLKLFKYTPLKTIIQISSIFIMVNSILLFGLSGNDLFTDFIDVTIVGNHYDELVTLRYFEDEALDPSYEPLTRVYGSIQEVNGEDVVMNTTVYGLSPESDLKYLIDNDKENNLLLHDGIIISSFLSDLSGADEGDDITFMIGTIEVTYEVQGVSNELIEGAIYMDRVTLNSYYGLGEEDYNAVLTTDGNYDNPYFLSRVNYLRTVEEFTSILNISSIIINFIAILSIILGLYIFLLIMILYITENKKNISILKAMGYTSKEVNIKYMLGIGLILIITYLISIPLTNFFLDLMLKSIMEIIGFKLVLTLKLVNIIIGLVFLVGIYVFSLYFTYLYSDKLSIVETLKSE